MNYLSNFALHENGIKSCKKANGINCTKFAHQQVAQIIAESEKFLRMKILPDESSESEESEDEEELDANGNPKLKVSGSFFFFVEI